MSSQNNQISKSLQKKLRNNLDKFTNNPDSVLFCKMMDYNDSNIKHSFNSALKQLSTNEYFIINNKDVDDFGLISDSLTNISTAFYEERIRFENNIFFGPTATSNVSIMINGTEVNPGDSIDTTKYNFLSPVGVHFDQIFKAFVEPAVGFVVRPFSQNSSVNNKGSTSFTFQPYTFSIATSSKKNNENNKKINAKTASIYSKSRKEWKVKK